MEISASLVKDLRTRSGAGVIDCRNALIKTEGDMDKALALLKEQGVTKAKKKTERTTKQGLVESYIHTGGRVGAIIEINCETDFVARTEDFKNLAHDLAMQVTACAPVCVAKEDMKEDEEADPETACLLLQPFIKDPSQTIQDVITTVVAKTGENIKVGRFIRFELGE